MLEWWPDWKGETLVIIASGPSASEVDLGLIKDERVMTINSSIDLFPVADAAFACDFVWWRSRDGLGWYDGLKITTDPVSRDRFGINYVKCLKGDDRIQTEEKGVVGWGGNSGFQCLNLALLFEVKKVILIGYDMNLYRGLHWHGAHPPGLNNPKEANVNRWRKAVDDAARIMKQVGIAVYNCSPNSSLQNYKKLSLKEALCA